METLLPRRCLFVQLISQHVEVSLVAEEVLQWLQLVHAQSPGAAVFLVCSHAESPPKEFVGELKEWQQKVKAFAEEVSDKGISPP